VLLFADTFNRAFEPENLRAAQRVLRAAGYRPIVPRRRLCCGRSYLSAGMVERARAETRRTLAALAGPLPVVGLEPSCLLTLRDEFRSLLPGAETDDLAARALLLGEFLTRHASDLKLRPLAERAHVHGHCHQKSFGAFSDTLASLRRVPGLEVRPIESSCCGMAGAFGYQAETQDTSRAMAESGLVPAVRGADPGDLIVADGTSCRHQIRDLTGRAAVHSAIVLAGALQPCRPRSPAI
jgi:Fe-S oxidoreductase